ncbi:hypothetical protein HZA57_00675 [Candidatus Poribacteria bacterium]|nr:hypothetical protein [Candidatus Poribacteria bacterium]
MKTIRTHGRRHSHRAFATGRRLIVASAICALLFRAVCLADDPTPIPNPTPVRTAETIRLSVGSLSPLQPAADWATEGVMLTPSASEADDILPYASNDGATWPNVYSPLTTQAVFQDGLWEAEGTRDDQFAHRFQWMRAASYNALSNLTSASGPGGTRESAAALDPSKAINVFVLSTTGVGAVIQVVLTKGGAGDSPALPGARGEWSHPGC